MKLSNNIKEIYTKATIASGKKKNIYKFEYAIEQCDKVLGCWITNHEYQAHIKNNKPYINGKFDLHVWYQKGNDSLLRKENNSYVMEMDLTNKSHTYHESDSLLMDCTNYPKCIGVNLNDNIVEIQIEVELSLKVVGDTTLLIESKDKTNIIDSDEVIVNDKFIT